MNKVIVAVVAVLIVGGGALALSRGSDDTQTAPPTETQTPASSSTPSDSQPSSSSTIVYDGSTFTPNALTVQSGSKVTIKNTSANNLQFDSDPHPTHTDDEDLNAGPVAPGDSITFTVTKKGTYGYHNHLNPTEKGTIQVN